MSLNNQKKPAATSLRIQEDKKKVIEEISEFTRLKQVEVVTLIFEAGIEALKPHLNGRLTLPLRFELVDVGKNSANRKIAQKRARKNALSEMPVEGFEPTKKINHALAKSRLMPLLCAV